MRCTFNESTNYIIKSIRELKSEIKWLRKRPAFRTVKKYCMLNPKNLEQNSNKCMYGAKVEGIAAVSNKKCCEKNCPMFKSN